MLRKKRKKKIPAEKDVLVVLIIILRDTYKRGKKYVKERESISFILQLSTTKYTTSLNPLLHREIVSRKIRKFQNYIYETHGIFSPFKGASLIKFSNGTSLSPE